MGLEVWFKANINVMSSFYPFFMFQFCSETVNMFLHQPGTFLILFTVFISRDLFSLACFITMFVFSLSWPARSASLPCRADNLRRMRGAHVLSAAGPLGSFTKAFWNNRSNQRKVQPDHKRFPSSCLLGADKGVSVSVIGILAFTSENSKTSFDAVEVIAVMVKKQVQKALLP